MNKWNVSTIVLKELPFKTSSSQHLLELPSRDNVQDWLESFTSLVASPYGVILFREFLKSEFSNENLDFWLAVQDFKKCKPQELASKANMIYKDFITSQSPNQVNLDHETRSNIHNSMKFKNFHQGMFDPAQRRIQYIMEQDSYARFKDSDLFIRAIDLLKRKNSK